MKYGWNVKAWLAAGLAALVAGSAWAQRTAPVNPAAARWQRERAAKAAEVRPKAPRPAAVRGTTGGADEDFGFVPELLDTGYLSDLNANLVQGVGDELPARYDLREQSAVTPVRDQGDYGTCWAFAAMGALESWIAKSECLATDWSENHLANRHGWNLDFAAGGNAQMVQGYLLRWAGPVEESADAYPRPGESPADALPGRHVQRVLWIPGKTAALDHDGLKAALMAHGALYVSYYHAAGYYNPSTAAYCFSAGGAKSPLSNHAVALVGWDDAYPRENFKIPPPGDGAYLVKNSWGGDWGDGGYFHVSYHDAFFARSTVYAFADAEETGNYDAVYGHDPLGMVGSVGFNAPSAWGANVFTAAAASKIAAAGFYAMVPRTTYTLRVYTGCSKNAPRSGTLASEQSGTVDEAGYVTIPLASPAEVAEDERFSVVLHLTTPGYPYPLASEYAVPGFTSAATAGAGESFLSLDGVSWHDFTKRIDSTANFCCKAYAKAEVAARELSSLAISGVNSLKAGGTALFTCEAVYSDGTRQAVSPVWDIAEGADWASVAADGTVTANPVSSQQTVTLRATYAEDGATATATWKFLVTVGAPAAPAGLAATEGTEETCVRLSWEAAPAASSYAVYRGLREDSARAGYLGTVTATRYADASAVPGVDYRYFVKAKNDSGSSPFGDGAWGWRALSAPAALAASDGLEASVELSWNAAEGASAYRVFRSEDPLADDPAPLGSWQAECRFSDTAAEAGTVYFYSVAAAIDAEGTRAGARCLPVEGRRTGPVALQSLEIAGPASLASGASGTYHCTALYTDGSAVGVAPEWSVSSGTLLSDGADAVVTAPIVAENGSLSLSAAFTEDGVSCTARFDIRLVPVVPAAPEGLSVQAATAEGGISLAWSPVPGASGYLVSRGSAADSLEAIATVASPAHADVTAVPGIVWWYGVSAVNAAGTGPMAGPVQAVRPVAAPTGVEAGYGTDRDAVHVVWQSVLGATRYRVIRAAADSSAAPTPISGWIDVLAFDDTTAEPGLEYLYSVQAAADADGFAAGPLGGPATGMRAITPRPVSLSIRGPAAVAAGESAVYEAKARWNDGTECTVSPVWSLSGADGLASVSADGTLTVGELAANVDALLRTSFTEGETTVSASLSVQLRAPDAPVASLSAVSSRTRWPWNGWIDIDYTLETSPEGTLAAIALAATDLDHRVPLLPSTLEGAGADGLPVAAGSHRLSWNLAADYPDFHAKDFQLSLSATPAEPVPTNAVPHYLVIDLSGGTSASSWPISYLDAEPEGGFNTDEYKTSKLVLRCIEAGTFTMGSPADELGRNTNEPLHQVTFSRPFWMGIFEVTQKQWELAMGSVPTPRTGDTRPVDSVSYNDIRGSGAGSTWPRSNAVDEGSFLAVVRAKTGLVFDLPTDAQWEYACRAGTTTALPNGKNLTSATGKCPNLAEVSRYGGNKNDGKGGYSEHTVVGCYLPNEWGLYDMLGNVWEWCLDWYDDNPVDATDPVGAASGTRHLARGGGWNDYGHRAALRSYGQNTPDFRQYNTGLRLVCPVGDKRAQRLEFAAIGPQSLASRVELSATATSGGIVTFAVVSGPGAIDGNVLTFTGAGTVVVSATQAGNDEWESVTVTQTVQVATVAFYAVIDMTGGRDAAIWPVSYLEGMPDGGFNTDEYKTTKLVLRRIDAGTFTMGSPADELGRNTNEPLHQVTFSRPFWMGIFEVTQKQWELAMGSVPTPRTGDTRPVDWVSYNDIRGSVSGATWPASNAVDDGSFLAVVRAKTGLVFDLPTDAQWEYACRAGTTTALNNGKNLTSATGTCPNLAEVSRYGGNKNDGKGGYNEHTVVGSYQPNVWGLYDMLGNVWEWCIDWYDDNPVDATDPVGAASGTRHLARGGGWNDYGHRSALRSYAQNVPDFRQFNTGLRLVCPASGKSAQQLDFAPIGPQSLASRVKLTATATSGGIVTFAVVSGPGAIDGDILSFSAVGTVVVAATQAGNDEWEAVTVTQTVQVEEVPLYAVVDMSGGTGASSWPVSYLQTEPAGGFNTDAYKTTKLVLRRIEAGTFTMGSPADELGRNTNEPLHQVTFSRPFWMGIFEVTQKQWELAMGSVPTPRTGDTRPVDWVSYNDIRGANDGSKWPRSNAVDDGSFLAVVRAKTGLVFDLPTDAQWEYACRAGTTTALNNGKNLTSTRNCPNLAEVSRYGGNKNDGKGGYGEHTVVGSYQPNAWGLYDMLGNVWEWCVDWYDDNPVDATDPVGAASGSRHLARGGGWNDYGHRSALRSYGQNVPSFRQYNTGLRLVCPVEP